jgi:Na+-transporting methylmalonyl-CoA/oxaloacetate decarboxylase gamma subunit
VGIVCLLLCLSLVFLVLYILPYLIWKLNYDLPEFITTMIAFFQDKYYATELRSRVYVGLVLFIPILVTGFVSYYVSNFIDDEIYKNELTSDEAIEEKNHSDEIKRDIKESATIGFEIIGLIILVIAALTAIQFLI